MKGPANGILETNGKVSDGAVGAYPTCETFTGGSMSVKEAAGNSDKLCEYSGYEPPPGVHTIDAVSPDMDPQEFFNKYVARRCPVVIKGHLTDSEWKGNRWTNEYLKKNAGDTEIIVERRGESKEAAFGLTAPKVHMTYGEFVDNVVKRNDRLYLTTQDLERFEEDLDDHDMPKAVLAEPLRSLQDDFSLRPKLLGNLIPYQLSLWQGVAKSGTSSGLHHDYHDNLYVLMRGRKRFRLFPPSAGPQMKTSGIISKIHSNGLIVYRNKPDDPACVVRSDGVPISFVVRQKRDDAMMELSQAEEALEELLAASEGEETQEITAEKARLEKIIEETEKKVDETMKEMEVYGCPGSMESDEDDYDEDDQEPKAKKQRISLTEEDLDRAPDHFCTIKFPTDSDDPDVIFSEHSHLKQVGCIVCDLSAGDMLFLPASWFHEVTSYSQPEGSEIKEVVKCSDDVGHLALNYWFYPADNDLFEQPYKHEFWPKRWERIQQGSPLPIQHVWSSDDEEVEGDGEGEEDDI